MSEPSSQDKAEGWIEPEDFPEHGNDATDDEGNLVDPEAARKRTAKPEDFAHDKPGESSGP